MADQPVTIPREKYEAGIKAAASLIFCTPAPLPAARHAINAFLATAGLEIERTAEERLAAFVRALKASHGPDMPGLPDLIREHFPEASL